MKYSTKDTILPISWLGFKVLYKTNFRELSLVFIDDIWSKFVQFLVSIKRDVRLGFIFIELPIYFFEFNNDRA